MIDTNGWIHCPICHNKTKTKVNSDTTLYHFPLFCPMCRNMSKVDVEDGQMKLSGEKSVSDGKTYNVNCGRTENRGNWVEVEYSGISVKISDNRNKATPQIALKDLCIDVLEKI